MRGPDLEACRLQSHGAAEAIGCAEEIRARRNMGLLILYAVAQLEVSRQPKRRLWEDAI